jgi:predicted ATP-grasp superfamily ATP-dependent carboligase
MESKKNNLVPAVVVNTNTVVALAAVRSLGRNGVPVIGVFGESPEVHSYSGIVKSSRFLSRWVSFDESDYERACLHCLMELGRELPAKAVLFPASDRDMYMISEHRDPLKEHYHLLLPSHEMVDTLLDKHKFHEFMGSTNPLIPRTCLPSGDLGIDVLANQVNYPCIIKPFLRDEEWIRQYGNTKVFLCDSASKLKDTFAAVHPHFDKVMVQEVVPGPETNIVCTFTYLDSQSNPLGMFTCRKIRQYPPLFGNTALAESASDPEAEEITRRLCKELGLAGYVSIEFKRDARTMALKILEFTVGRINRQVGLSDACGMNIPYLWYCHLLGRKTAVRVHRESSRWASEVNELRAFRPYLRSREWTLWNWIRSYRQVRQWELFSWDDLRPFSKLLLSIFHHAPRR